MEEKHSYLSWIEISQSAFLHNLRKIKGLLKPSVKLLAVVKANAYGHGLTPTVKVLKKAGVDFWGVISLEEAFLLKKLKLKEPILIMGYVPLSDLEEVVEEEFRVIVYNLETVERLSALANRWKKRVYLHLKLETGTYRQGVDKKNLPLFLELIKKSSYLVLEGIATHFANIEDTTNHIYARFQLRNFLSLAHYVKKSGLHPTYQHTACSAAAILFPETHFNLVRIGISLYGLWPSKETYIACLEKGGAFTQLKPVLSWKTKIVQIKDVPAGAYIGYGCTYKTTTRTKIAVLPVGYADGYDRRLSNRGYVLIKGSRCPLRGRVCMNMIMVDLTHLKEVRVEDEVILIGKEGEEEVSVDTLASLCQTINYEIVSRLSPFLPRLIAS